MAGADRSAAVFGASGAIGRALVERLARVELYDRVYAGSRAPGEGLQPSVVPFRFDLADEPSIAQAASRFAPAPDLVLVTTGLLHDAARGIAPEKSLKALDDAAMAQLFAVNTIGPALIAKHVLPRLPRDRRAVFGVLSARVGSIGDNRLGGWHAYRASKAALNMLVRNFAIELARTHPLAVVAGLHPGTIDSALSLPFQRGVAPERLFAPDRAAEQLLQVLHRLTPQDSGGLFAWDGSRLPE